jgi:hypothetical protein
VSQNQSRRHGEEKNLLPLRAIEPLLRGRLACSLLAIPLCGNNESRTSNGDHNNGRNQSNHSNEFRAIGNGHAHECEFRMPRCKGLACKFYAYRHELNTCI